MKDFGKIYYNLRIIYMRDRNYKKEFDKIKIDRNVDLGHSVHQVHAGQEFRLVHVVVCPCLRLKHTRARLS